MKNTIEKEDIQYLFCNLFSLKYELSKYEHDKNIFSEYKYSHQLIVEGDFVCLEYLLKNGYTLNKKSCEICIDNNKSEKLKYLLENGYGN